MVKKMRERERKRKNLNVSEKRVRFVWNGHGLCQRSEKIKELHEVVVRETINGDAGKDIPL